MNKPHKLLIANRGEIAVRIIQACKDLDIHSVAIYADDDVSSLHARLADEAWALSGVTAKESYLDIDKILNIARHSQATMIHPGYGFLSERADFAQAVIDAGLIWIGPSPESIEKLGDKIQARKIAQSVGAPLVQGTAQPLKSANEAVAFAQEYGLPIAIKAAYGGGGRGLKVAWQLDEVASLYESAVREAQAAFGRGECFVEQYLDRPRHLEAQIIADQHGHVLVVGTRDCSLQRRNQKLVEEAPAPFISQQVYQQLVQSSVDICRAAQYVGAGTVEYLLSQDGKLSFLEVNTRLQVEHPVTEQTTGIDLVVEQIQIALGQPLSIQETPEPQGHAIEFRINAEDPARGFIPAFGQITQFNPPSGIGIRLDTGVMQSSLVSSHFDSLMAKLIVTGATREIAIQRAKRALAQFELEGVASVLPFHQAILSEPDFVDEFKVHTRWIEQDYQNESEAYPRSQKPNHSELQRYPIEIDGKLHQIGLPIVLFSLIGSPKENTSTDQGMHISQHENDVLAPINGVITEWKIQENDHVEQGNVIAIMEAMKMEVQVVAHRTGQIKSLAALNQTLNADTKIAEIV
ncbi:MULTISPECIES: biotin carboxylase N-terminal domain-containing protein [unclassified Acinetobacter]|uniref:acetyl/propionyl/methylcrotonyl-CoA carboxylase subunit alpha n=1 Tax=unclassified Acinetobacter TaxID=196816 RepID=UPI00244D17F3|nr:MULTISPECIES: biotin carboxylase N-terminal domain-containing protein [unclassified Acinetobacter]MDH0030139.1 biotin/lipoyl-binding protein [Acinetobacter sp. GD04021]MDH0885029.1 biotin/lipoyl-binding protein [Acinetobacter sp. GD03873]MDH1082327.1 biotin/lipoyl-binding protein [Acinetobacter sp. GD03983]MDH2188530.1 biotin/lipoyl-binding protein [Acinetobacter sp. GD03645]MDH2201947.1 biotin/lipoyl-binding protein [Acinetobacter sp. GD03647]